MTTLERKNSWERRDAAVLGGEISPLPGSPKTRQGAFPAPACSPSPAPQTPGALREQHLQARRGTLMRSTSLTPCAEPAAHPFRQLVTSPASRAAARLAEPPRPARSARPAGSRGGPHKGRTRPGAGPGPGPGSAVPRPLLGNQVTLPRQLLLCACLNCPSQLAVISDSVKMSKHGAFISAGRPRPPSRQPQEIPQGTAPEDAERIPPGPSERRQKAN